MKRRYLVLFIQMLLFCFSSCQQAETDRSDLSIITSDRTLEREFNWAKEKARSYVMTGRTGVIDKSEQFGGKDNVMYIPCYQAGYPFRSAFYIRDYCHQLSGAHLLGLQNENLAMLKSFLKTATETRKWYPIWALNFDGSPYAIDYVNDSCFVRQVPAVFELVEKAYKQYLWTGNREIIENPMLWNTYTKMVTDFVSLHDSSSPNGIAEGDGSGNIFNGTTTYNEFNIPLIEAGDGVAAQYQAYCAYASMLYARGEYAEAESFQKKSQQLKDFFNQEWGVKAGDSSFVRAVTIRKEQLTDFGRENSIFMPMKHLTEPSSKTKKYLEYCHNMYKETDPSTLNIESMSYLPDAYFAYNMVDKGWEWIKRIQLDCEKNHIVPLVGSNRNYPEVSYTTISNVVENMLGFEPDAPSHSFATIPRLPKDVAYLGVDNIILGKHTISVLHEGNTTTTIKHIAGDKDIQCTVRFYGYYTQISIDKTLFTARQSELNGEPISQVTVTIPIRGSIRAKAIHTDDTLLY